MLRCELRLGRVVRWRWDGKAKVQAAAAYHSATSTPGKRPTHLLQPNTNIQIEFKFLNQKHMEDTNQGGAR